MDKSAAELFYQGKLYNAYEYFGAHVLTESSDRGVRFRLWAPNARQVSVVGDFNDWRAGCAPMQRCAESGIWEAFLTEVKEGDRYKYFITTQNGRQVYKSDPYAFLSETHHKTASVIYNPMNKYIFSDVEWKNVRSEKNIYTNSMNIYELHLGSWCREEDGGYLDYRSIARQVVPYVKEMGYTHIELMPLAEYPYDGSWGYQVCGYFAPTSRYGRCEDLMYFVDFAHAHQVGVILDWVPAHFPKDEHGLALFDGTYLYEDEDFYRREHKAWGTLAFDFEKPEVKSFLISNALFWLKTYHFDGLRVDAVEAMLYLDYGREEGQWQPNELGGRINLEAAAFLKQLNEAVRTEVPEAIMIAEEATAYPGVTAPVEEGGLGFHFKWNLGWMNDALAYVKKEAQERSEYHRLLTFSMMYAFDEHFILPISHDEVVYLKKSLLNKMPGSHLQKLAGVRVFVMYLYTLPGKKLMFMGSEFGQEKEWHYDEALQWHLAEENVLQKAFFMAMGQCYLQNRPLWECERDWSGFRWADADNAAQSILSYERYDAAGEALLVVLNFSFTEHPAYELKVKKKIYEVILDSDNIAFGGGSQKKVVVAEQQDGGDWILKLSLPPLNGLILKPVAKEMLL